MNRTVTHSDPKFHKKQKVRVVDNIFNTDGREGIIHRRFYDIDDEIYTYVVSIMEDKERSKSNFFSESDLEAV